VLTGSVIDTFHRTISRLGHSSDKFSERGERFHGFSRWCLWCSNKERYHSQCRAMAACETPAGN